MRNSIYKFGISVIVIILINFTSDVSDFAYSMVEDTTNSESNTNGNSSVTDFTSNENRIVKMYMENSSDYKNSSFNIDQMVMDYEKNELTIKDYLERIDETKRNIEDTTVTLNKARDYHDTENIENLEKVIKQYERQLSELNYNYKNSLLQKKINSFYVNNYDSILKEQQKVLIYNFYKKYLSIPVYQKQIKYYKTLLMETKEELSVEEDKLRIGYSTKLNVKNLKNQVETVKTQIVYLQNELDNINNELITNLGVNELVYVDIDEDITIKGKEEYIATYNCSTKLIKLSTEKEAYNEFILSLDSTNERDNLSIKESQLKVKSTDNEISKYKKSNSLYILELINKYNNEYSQINSSENKIASINNKLKNQNMMLEKGKCTKVDILKTKAELANAEYEKENAYFNARMIFYALSNCIVSE